jgi:hypothetical protein
MRQRLKSRQLSRPPAPRDPARLKRRSLSRANVFKTRLSQHSCAEPNRTDSAPSQTTHASPPAHMPSGATHLTRTSTSSDQAPQLRAPFCSLAGSWPASAGSQMEAAPSRNGPAPVMHRRLRYRLFGPTR